MKFDKAKKRHSFKHGDQEDLNKVNQLVAKGEKYNWLLTNEKYFNRLPTCGPHIRTLDQYSNITF